MARRRPPLPPTSSSRPARTASGSGAPSRRRAAVGVAALAIALAAGLWWWTTRPPTARLTPAADQNVLLVTIDTLRADATSAYGGPAATPELERLARDGVRFDFAHAHAVLTLPSHTSILTGTYPYQHGVRENSGYRLAAGTPTLATWLKQAGYTTGAFLGAFPLSARYGLDPGFDVYDDRFGAEQGPADFSMAERPANEVVAPAARWIAGQRGKWFAWVHVFDPHAPYRPPPPYDRDYAGRLYHGEVAWTDHALAPLFAQARASARPTLVVVTGDHGEALGDHGELTHGLFAYESTLRVPLILAQVGASAPEPTRGEISDTPAQHVDLVPTILAALGIAAPPGLPGRSLIDPRERRADGHDRASYFEAMSSMLNRGWAPLSGVLAGRDKFIDLPLPELYDLARDPKEASNLAASAGEQRRVLEARLAAFGAALPGERAVDSADALARLQALGYVSGHAPRKARYTEQDDPKRLVGIDRAFHDGVDLYQAHRLPEAVKLYQQIVTERPDMGIAYRHLAFVQWETGDLEGAVTTLRRALAAGARESGLPAQLGNYLAETGQAKQALEILKASGAESSSDVDVLNSVGIAYARGGDAARALDTFRRILTLDRSNAMALENIGTIHLQRNQLAEAAEALSAAVAADPKSSRARAGLAVVELKRGNRSGAIDGFRQAVQLDPTNFDALFNLGNELARSGDMPAARPYLEQFVRTAPRAFYGPDIDRIARSLGR